MLVHYEGLDAKARRTGIARHPPQGIWNVQVDGWTVLLVHPD